MSIGAGPLWVLGVPPTRLLKALTVFFNVTMSVSTSRDPEQCVLDRSSMMLYRILTSHSLFGGSAIISVTSWIFLSTFQEDDGRFLWGLASLHIWLPQLG